MFGLTVEKLMLVGVIAAFLIGPERLPQFASLFANFVRQLKSFAETAKERVKDEMGPEYDEVDWKTLDPKQYDPRKIIRDALAQDGPPEQTRPLPASADSKQAPKSNPFNSR